MAHKYGATVSIQVSVKIWISSALLWSRQWTFGFFERSNISGPRQRPPVSEVACVCWGSCLQIQSNPLITTSVYGTPRL